MQIQLSVEKYKLPNGLTVLLLPDKKISLVSLHTWYRVGSKNEKLGVTGAAHMLEHMMFKGAKRYTGKSFDSILNSLGAVNNAFTTSDYTGFYENFPSEHLQKILDIESDRMESLALRNEDLQSEREVVKEERRWRVDNSPEGQLEELFNKTIFKNSNYTWPVIGYMKDIQDFSIEKLRFFHDNYYGPNNAILVIVGNFEIENAKKWIDQYYGQIASRPVPEFNFIPEQEQKQARAAILTKNVQTGKIIMGYPAVSITNQDSIALDLLAAILGQGSSSRLHQQLVYRHPKASQIVVENSTYAKAGVFEIHAALMPHISALDLANEIRKEVARLKFKVVTEKELVRAKNQVLKMFISRMMTTDEKARVLAEYEILHGDYKRIHSEIDDYMKVTADDILGVARKYLIPQHENFVELKSSNEGVGR